MKFATPVVAQSRKSRSGAPCAGIAGVARPAAQPFFYVRWVVAMAWFAPQSR